MSLEISNSTVRITDLVTYSATPQIEDLVAQNVTFIGPAILALLPGDIAFEGKCTFSGNFESILWEVDDSRTAITGAVGLVNPTFRDCNFVNIGFAVQSQNVHGFAQMINIR